MLESNGSSKRSSNTDRARNELAQAKLADQRPIKRLVTFTTDLAQHPTAPISQACGSWDQIKAACRFFDNQAG